MLNPKTIPHVVERYSAVAGIHAQTRRRVSMIRLEDIVDIPMLIIHHGLLHPAPQP